MDKYWPSDLAEPEQKVSLLNEVPEFRDRGTAQLLHRWPKAVPLRAVLKDALANLEVLLSRLEGGVHCPQDMCAHYETVIRELYLRSQDEVRVLRDALELIELE